MSRILLILFFLASACESNRPPNKTFDQPFDPQIIAKLPIYDSLTRTLIEYYPFIQQPDEQETYSMYRFSTDSAVFFGRLGPERSAKVRQYIQQLGKGFIRGCQIYKDSTVKIFIRDFYSGELNMDVGERLSYFPNPGTMTRRKAPNKDTVLTKNWLYWISLDDAEIF
ncbi:MAG: hypothetical protein H7Y31_11155 [Chitinophagaceae bacterium]|nr:hypothetical protein [Chitinophagaceae bacterium]